MLSTELMGEGQPPVSRGREEPGVDSGQAEINTLPPYPWASIQCGSGLELDCAGVCSGPRISQDEDVPFRHSPALLDGKFSASCGAIGLAEKQSPTSLAGPYGAMGPQDGPERNINRVRSSRTQLLICGQAELLGASGGLLLRFLQWRQQIDSRD